MRQLLFAFVLGGVVGAFAALVVTHSPEPTPVEAPVEASTPTNALPDDGDESITISHDADDTELAMNLDRARFDRNWDRVTAVSRILRERTGARAASPARAFEPNGARTSMILLDHDYRRRTFLLELAAHENDATRIASSDAPSAQRERELSDLLEAPLVKPTDATVRRDAAILLGFMRTPTARAALVRTLRSPDADLALLAAEALGRSQDEAATEALLEILAKDLDAGLRARSAQALVWTRDAAAGGEVAVALARAAREDRDLSVRTHAISGLARVDLEACDVARQLLIALLEDEAQEAPVRLAGAAAVRAHQRLARGLPSDVIEALEAALQATSGRLRLEVIAALGEGGRPESLPLLEAQLLGAADPNEAEALRQAVATLSKRAPPQ